MTRPSPNRRHLILTAIWLIAMLVAIAADAPVARFARASGLAAAVKGRWWADDVLKAPGNFWFAAVVVGGLWAARRVDWRQAVYVLGVVAFSGLNVVVKWAVGRTRPYRLPATVIDQPRPLLLHPFGHGLDGLFHQVDLCFPSGHACTAFALAAGVLVVWRPAGRVLFAAACVVGAERVAENAHYLSDVVGAAGFSAAGAWLATATGLHRRGDPAAAAAPADAPS